MPQSRANFPFLKFNERIRYLCRRPERRETHQKEIGAKSVPGNLWPRTSVSKMPQINSRVSPDGNIYDLCPRFKWNFGRRPCNSHKCIVAKYGGFEASATRSTRTDLLLDYGTGGRPTLKYILWDRRGTYCVTASVKRKSRPLGGE